MLDIIIRVGDIKVAVLRTANKEATNEAPEDAQAGSTLGYDALPCHERIGHKLHHHVLRVDIHNSLRRLYHRFCGM